MSMNGQLDANLDYPIEIDYQRKMTEKMLSGPNESHLIRKVRIVIIFYL